MKTCKKLFSLLLVAVMLVSAIPFASFADEAGGEPVAVSALEKKVFKHLYVAVDGVQTETAVPITYEVQSLETTRREYTGNDAAAFGRELLSAANLQDKYSTGYEYVLTVLDFSTIGGDANASVTLKKISHTHSWKAILTGATDTQHIEVCDCGAEQYVDHTLIEESPAKPATHTAVGKDADKKCSVCGYEIKGKELPKLTEHKFVKGECECGAKQYTINYKLDGKDVSETYVDATGNADMSSAKKVLAALGKNADAYNTSDFNKTDYNISFTATTIPTTTSYTTLALTVDGKSENVGINPAYTKSGSVSNSDAADILKAAKRSYKLSEYNVTVNASGSTIYMTLNTIGRYTVNCIVNGEKFAPKTNVPYYGTFTNSDAQAILKAADITVNGTYQQSVVSVSGSVITVELYNEIVVRVYNNANSFSQVTMRVGYPYINYLGTNLINNATFGGITIKNQAGQNTYRSASDVNGGKALVGAYDEEVTIQRNGDSCTLNFLRSDGTVLESRKLYAGDQIGTLPSYIVGNVPAVWTYNGKPISATDVYNFKTTSVNIQPYFGGISDVYVDVYTNGNVKTLQTRVKVTDMVQNGVLYLNSEVKSAISSALRNSSNKNLTYTAFFDASTWSDFIKTKNTNGAAEPIRVGDNSERQGSVYLYVMVNNVTQKATDSTNPKTGDDVKLGVAAAVLAVAVVGFGAAIVIKKKKGVQ